ncbi:MAG: glycine--tRNA ligase [Deltaproteobacteria bacterium]|nr:glycine--tRNA ligase [Deltaproteobacteria bacterium]
MDEIVSLAKRRGFVFQSSEIYGGINGFWDFGPVGVELRRKIKDFWWKRMVYDREDVVGVDTSIIAHPETWKASGHLDCFSDPMVDCKKCKHRFRADELQGPVADSVHGHKPALKKCPDCGGELTEAKQFNLMFQTHVGASQDSTSVAYLRPETCQSIFTQFKNVLTTSRQKIPFGIAQIGKSFRNEITPRNFIFRSREFEQMELEFFIRPTEAEGKKWYEYWKAERLKWFYDLGIKKESLRQREHAKDELAHYARACVDVEYNFPIGWSELEGIADRSNYDLSQHMKFSKKDLQYFDDEAKEKYVPAVVECSVGVDRTFLTILCDAFAKDKVEGEERIVMRFAPHIAPFQAAVFPLSRKLALPAHILEKDLRKHFQTDFDDIGSIGKRYRRHDEIGTPFCITYDFQSEEDKKVTVRDRDTTKQDRIAIDQAGNYLRDKLRT